jgi:hypothetical protein
MNEVDQTERVEKFNEEPGFCVVCDPGVGIKHDQGKPRIDLVPPRAILEVAAVLTDGVEEYGEHNWRQGIAYSRLYSAIQRHLLAFWSGDDVDKSGHRTLAHACTDIMMLMEMHKNWDDRYPIYQGSKEQAKKPTVPIDQQRLVDTRPTGV